MTQADLAYAAESSTRHLSCLETGKAQPLSEADFWKEIESGGEK